MHGDAGDDGDADAVAGHGAVLYRDPVGATRARIFQLAAGLRDVRLSVRRKDPPSDVAGCPSCLRARAESPPPPTIEPSMIEPEPLEIAAALSHRDHSRELDRRAREDARLDPDKPLAPMTAAETAAYLQATRAELRADDWLKSRLAAPLRRT